MNKKITRIINKSPLISPLQFVNASKWIRNEDDKVIEIPDQIKQAYINEEIDFNNLEDGIYGWFKMGVDGKPLKYWIEIKREEK